MDAQQLTTLVSALTVIVAAMVGVIGRWATTTGKALRRSRARNQALEKQVYASWREIDKAGGKRPSLPNALTYLVTSEDDDE